MECFKCKKPGVKVKFNTLEFYYCRECKDEIVPGPPPFKHQAENLPKDYAALKGERLTCESCHTVIGILNQDLPSKTNPTRWMFSANGFDYIPVSTNTINNACCYTPSYRRLDTGRYEYHIYGKGWV